MSPYLYAVIPAGRPSPVVGGRGIDGGEITSYEVGRVAAVTSPVSGPRTRPSRANVQAHEQVVSAAHAAGPVLPVRFGTVLPDRRTLRDEVLEPAADEMEEMLAYFDGRDEYRVRATYLPDVPLREALAANRRLRRLRDRVRAAGAGTDTMVELGETVFAELTRIREDDAARLISRVERLSVAWEILQSREEDVAAHAAALVDSDAAGRLHQAIDELARDQAGRLRLEVIGPLPPWDFCDLEIGAA